jgi:glucose/arabinose dehydrogenase
VGNVASAARLSAWGAHQERARLAVDGDTSTLWSSEQYPVAWIALSYDRPYRVERIELVTGQNPSGSTTHEVWVGNGPELSLLTRLAANTNDQQVLTVPVTPARDLTRILVNTTSSPSYVAWREIRVFGQVAGPPPAGIKLTPFVRGGPVGSPTGITYAGDGSGRVFVLEQQGRVWVVAANGERRNQPFLEIPERVNCCNERGLLGLAFPPGYPRQRYFYVSYTSTARPQDGIGFGDLVISRFHLAADADAGNPRSEEVILRIPQATDAHHGGKLEFGPRDGLLYVSVGDGGPGGGAGGRALQTDVLQGKILRIDVESGEKPYGIPPANPYVGQSGYRPEILAYGLRNPWGMTIDPPSGDMYIADAGEVWWEEINVHRADEPWGVNYGWPHMEGRHCFPQDACDTSGITAPVTEFHHLEGCVGVGGAVARASRYTRIQGTYFYADFCSGRIFSLREEGGRWVATVAAEAGFPLSSIGRDEAGNVYVADYTRAQIYRIDE